MQFGDSSRKDKIDEVHNNFQKNNCFVLKMEYCVTEHNCCGSHLFKNHKCVGDNKVYLHTLLW